MGLSPSVASTFDNELHLAIPPHTSVLGRRRLARGDGKCTCCKKPFRMFFRKRHYCRLCGHLICLSCSVLRSVLWNVLYHGGQPVPGSMDDVYQMRLCVACNKQHNLLDIPLSVWHRVISYLDQPQNNKILQISHHFLRSVYLPFEWVDSWENYFMDRGHFLASGAYGHVYKTRRKSDPKNFVAVKKIDKERIFSVRKWYYVLREIETMLACPHENVISLLDVKQTDSSVLLVLEYADGGDVFDWLIHKLGHVPSERDVRGIAWQLLSALSFMHDEANAVHRDVKPENLLIATELHGFNDTSTPTLTSKAPRIKLGDFGFAKMIDPGEERDLRQLEDEMSSSGLRLRLPKGAAQVSDEVLLSSTPCGTLGFAAPEVLDAYNKQKNLVLNTQPTTSATLLKRTDVFAAGVTISILLTGAEPFPSNNQKEHLTSVKSGLTFQDRRWRRISSDARELMRMMLHPNPECRPTATQCLKHPWFVKAERRHLQRQESPVQQMPSTQEDRDFLTSLQETVASRKEAVRGPLAEPPATHHGVTNVSITSAGSKGAGKSPMASSQRQKGPMAVPNLRHIDPIDAKSVSTSLVQGNPLLTIKTRINQKAAEDTVLASLPPEDHPERNVCNAGNINGDHHEEHAGYVEDDRPAEGTLDVYVE